MTDGKLKVTHSRGMLIVRVDWEDGSMVPMAYADESDAELVMAEMGVSHPDDVIYALTSTAYAR
jgi:hypothetical protein